MQLFEIVAPLVECNSVHVNCSVADDTAYDGMSQS
jgi:hypothetical protein